MTDLYSAVIEGDHRESLVALRDLLATSLLNTIPEKRAPLAKQLAEVLREIEGLTKPKESALDDLAARRAARLSNPTGTDPT